jgi:myo-inositol 2-dehydrogenase / D-chiro-inositol 1-dehydrogenase
MTSELRVGVVGTGLMGTDHVARITHRIAGASVSAIIEPDQQRAAAAVREAPGARAFARVEDALDAGAADAVVIAAPGQFHEAILLPVLEAGLPALCEKPLTDDPESSWRVLEAEQKNPHPLIQVGFMRRFDAEYRQLRELIVAGTAGELLLLHCVHRNPAVADSYVESMLITDSLVHELDVVPWLAGANIASIEVRRGRRNPNSPSRINEPIVALIELGNGVLADVEMNVSVRFGYQVATEAVFASGVARIGQPSGLQLWHDGNLQVAEHQTYKTRFLHAFDKEVLDWVNAARQGRIAGPSAWDGFMVSVASAAGVKALHTSGPVPVELPEKPPFYSGA